MTVNVTWTEVIQILTLILSSGILTFLIYNLRGTFHIPDSKVPDVAHSAAIGVSVLIAIVTALSKGQPLTAQLIIAAILAGFGGANMAAGFHSNIKAKSSSKKVPGSAAVFPWAGPVPSSPAKAGSIPVPSLASMGPDRILPPQVSAPQPTVSIVSPAPVVPPDAPTTTS